MIQTSSNQPKIFTFATVAIPDGKGGVAETFKVEVPAFRNTETGMEFLGDEALEIVEAAKKLRMAGFIAGSTIVPERQSKRALRARSSRSSRCERQELAFA